MEWPSSMFFLIKKSWTRIRNDDEYENVNGKPFFPGFANGDRKLPLLPLIKNSNGYIGWSKQLAESARQRNVIRFPAFRKPRTTAADDGRPPGGQDRSTSATMLERSVTR